MSWKSQIIFVFRKVEDSRDVVEDVDVVFLHTQLAQRVNFTFVSYHQNSQHPKVINVKIVISEVYASFVLQCTVSGR